MINDNAGRAVVGGRRRDTQKVPGGKTVTCRTYNMDKETNNRQDREEISHERCSYLQTDKTNNE